MVKVRKQRKISSYYEIAESMINLYFDEGTNKLQYSYIVDELASEKYLNLSDRMKNLEYYPDEEALLKGRKPLNVFGNEVRTVRGRLVYKDGVKVIKEDTEAGSYELTSNNQEELLELVDKLFNKESVSRKSKIWYENLDSIIKNYLDISLVPLTLEFLTDDVIEFVDFSDKDRDEIESLIYNRLVKLEDDDIVLKTKNAGSKIVYSLI